MENNIVKYEMDFKNEIADLLSHYFYIYSVDPDANDIVYIDVYDVPDNDCKVFVEKIWNVVDKYKGKFEIAYVPSVVSRSKTIKYYPEHIIRECENCGQLIETSEIKSNPHAVYCRHCRITHFDGPDICD